MKLSLASILPPLPPHVLLAAPLKLSALLSHDIKLYRIGQQQPQQQQGLPSLRRSRRRAWVGGRDPPRRNAQQQRESGEAAESIGERRGFQEEQKITIGNIASKQDMACLLCYCRE